MLGCDSTPSHQRCVPNFNPQDFPVLFLLSANPFKHPAIGKLRVRTLLPRFILLTTLVGVALLSRHATADDSDLRIHAATPITTANLGDSGMMIGETGRLHPFTRADASWITNPGRQSTNVVSDLMTAYHIGLDLSRPSAPWDLSFSGDVEYDKYWGLENAATKSFTSIAGRANLATIFNKQGSINIRFNDALTRSADPGNQTW